MDYTVSFYPTGMATGVALTVIVFLLGFQVQDCLVR